jgi:hypothetical protein
MVRTAAALVERNESPRLDSAESSANDSSTASTSPARVMPPLYLSGRSIEEPESESESTDESTEESGSDEVASAESESEEDGESAEGESEEDSEEETEEESEEESAEKGASEETEGKGEETEGENEESEISSEGAGGESEGGASAEQADVSEEDAESIEVLVAKLPSMRPLVSPYVPGPPPQALKRREEILKRTGSPPDLHHAKVRQLTEQVTQAARDAQRRMITRLNMMGRDSRLSIEKMADEIAQATSAAVAQINVAIERATVGVNQAAQVRQNYLDTATMLVGTELEKHRDQVTVNIANSLREGSAAVRALDQRAQAEFTGYVAQARAGINQVPTAGKGERIPNPPRPPGAPPPRKQKPPKPKKYYLSRDTTPDLTTYIQNQAESKSRGDGPNCATYYRNRVAPYLTGYTARTQNQLVKSANTKAERVDSPATRAQFLINLLGLTTPAAEHHENDESEAARRAEDAIREQLNEVEYARHTAKKTIKEKSGMAIEYMDTDLRKNLTSNLWKSGKKAINAFRKQALAAEIAQQNNAASFSESYRSLVEQLKQYLPPGEFLDSRKLGPELIKERNKTMLLQKQHESLAQQQSQATLTQMDESKQGQVEGLEKAGREGAKNVANVVTQTAFDMEVFVQQVTTGASAGARDAMSAGATYANETAESINRSVAGPTSSGVLQIQNAAVGFLNGNISAAEQSQYAQLESFVETMQGGTKGDEGPLSTPMQEAKTLFEGKADRLHNHMPEPASASDMAAGGGLLLGAALLVPGVNIVAVGTVAVVGAGVYLYNHNPSENGVITELGDVVYPGTRAIGEVFARKGHGNLEDRIRSRLSDPEKQHALDLFDSTASVRVRSRRRIAEHSTSFLGYNRTAREAALSGMSEEEFDSMSSADVAATRSVLEAELDGHQEDVAIAFLEHNREAAVAARTRESLDNGVRDSSWGWRFTAESAVRDSDAARTRAVRDMDSSLRSVLAIENGFAEVMSGAELHDSRARTFREFASLTSSSSRADRRSASSFTDAEARSSFVNYATRSHDSYLVGPRTAAIVGAQALLGPLGPLAFGLGLGTALEGDRARVNMSSSARDYITAMVENDDQHSAEVRDARGIYEIRNAESEGAPSQATQLRLAQAIENRTLARYERDRDDPRLTPEERSRAGRLAEEERVRHRERLQAMAVGLGAASDISPEDAETFMRNRVGAIYARTDTAGFTLGRAESYVRSAVEADSSMSDTFMNRLGLIGTGSHRRFGEEMITHGRASLDASVALAADGAGTNDDLLTHGYADRSTTEIANARTRWAAEHHGEDMNEMLGIAARRYDASDLALFAASPATWLMLRGPETSGDLAMQLEVMALGNPTNDSERLAIAQLRQEQQTRGFAVIADAWMRGTPEEAQMTSTRSSVSTAILARALEANPHLRGSFDPENPSSIYLADGSIDPRIREAAFDSRGNFTGDRSMFNTSVSSMGQSADAYRAGVDRREAMLTQFITVMAIIASIAAMLIPGVNMVVAGVAIALIAGAATIAVKAGMRGARYGWEEAAMDVATTAIEAATAGVGGALGGGLGTKGMIGALGRVGQNLEKALGGKIAAAIVREAVVNAVSTAASTAIQDDTWKDGFGKGLSRVTNGAIRGAVVGGISGGLSTALTVGLGARMNAVQRDASKVGMLQRLGERMGPKTSEMLREGIANGVGTMASEIAGLGIDYAQGNFHGTFFDAVKHVGLATLRETVSGAARAGITAMHKEHYRTLLTAAQKSGNLGPAELKLLRLVGISAGVLHYNDSLGEIHNDIKASRDIIARMPPDMREHLSGMDHTSLQRIAHLIDSADIKYRSGEHQNEHIEFMRGLADLAPSFDPRKLMQQIDDVIDTRRAKTTEPLSPEQQTALRQKLGADLHEGIKFALDTLPVDALQHLSESELKHVASMIASGDYNTQHADQLMRAVKARNPNVDEHLFLKNLQGAVVQSRELQYNVQKTAIQRQRQLVELVPPESAHLFANLPPMDAMLAHNLLKAGNEGTPHQQEMLFQAARKTNPELSSDEFKQFITRAANDRRQQMAAEANLQRTKREESLEHLPKEIRGIVSALPESGLIELRLRQMEGKISEHQMKRLIKLAQEKTPDVDVHALRQALEQVVAEPPKAKLSEAETAELQRHLLSAVPQEQRATLANTPILVVSDAEFAQLTRSQKGQAVTLIIDGNPVVVMRENANPRVLREEGIHVMQANDPQWKAKIGVLDETHMNKWDSLSIEEQMGLYRNKVELELDAQAHLVKSLESDIANAKTREEKRALQKQLEQVQQAQKNLKNRMQEVGNMSDLDIANIKAGFSEKPQFLDQPARLFSKKSELVKKVVSDYKIIDEHKNLINSLTEEEIKHLNNIFNKLKEDGFDTATLFKSTKNNEDLKAVLNRIIYDDTRVRSANEQIQIAKQVIDLLKAASAADNIYSSKRANDLIYLLSKANYNDFSNIVNHLAEAKNGLSDTTHFIALLDIVVNSGVDKVTLIDNINKVLQHLDPKSQVALLSLLDQMADVDRIETLSDMAMIAEHALPDLAKELGIAKAHELLAVIIESVSTQRNWRSVAMDIFDLTYTLTTLPKTLENLANIQKIVKYILDSRGKLTEIPVINLKESEGNNRYKSVRESKENKKIAADIASAMDILREPGSQEVKIKGMAEHLDKDKSLAGGDTWLIQIEAKKEVWKDLKIKANSDKDVKAFVKALEETTKGLGWDDGHLGSLDKMQVWFKKLAESRGIRPDNADAMAALMKEVFDRGFPKGKHELTSEGKLQGLERAFRELTTETISKIDLKKLATVEEIIKNPEKLKEIADKLNLSVEQLLKRSDAAVLIEHMVTLNAREKFYQEMYNISKEIDPKAAGIKQNITEVQGEIALTQRILAKHSDFTLVIPFGKGTGFDQVWVRTANGKMEFIVGEAKGKNAKLGNPLKGKQMTAEWVLNTLKEMLASGEESKEYGLAIKMMEALKQHVENPGSPRPIRGLVVEYAPPDHKDNTTPETGSGGYEWSAEMLSIIKEMLKKLEESERPVS